MACPLVSAPLIIYMCSEHSASVFDVAALVNSEDPSLQFVLQTPVDALLVAELASQVEYLLVFSSQYSFISSSVLLSFCC